MNQQYIEIVRKLFDEVYTKGNIDKFDQFITTNIKLHDLAAPNVTGGLTELKNLEKDYKTAFPVKQVKIDEIFTTDNNKVVVRWTFTGAHKGNLQGISATNKNVKINGISIYTFANDKIADIFQVWDRLGLLEQIGEVEPAAALHR